ncbi:uncharacterized protein [Tenebrio molitor]|uniref:uncharacterized protein n=1 Tax=Tenebrio molitor TaxID=7067 RepID=UPI0036248CC4
MLPPINCARALLLLCLITTQAQGQHDNREGPPNEFERCENMTVFFNTLKTVSPVEGFKFITSPLACETCPVELKTLRRDLTVLLAKGLLNVKNILVELEQVGSRNRYDSLITTLLAMNEFLNVDATIKKTISNAVFYLLKKRHLRKSNGFPTVRSGFCEYPTYDRLVENPHYEGTGVYAGGVRKYHPETQPDSALPVYSAVPKYVVKPTYENYFQPITSTAYNPPPQQPFYAADFYHHPLAQASSASNDSAPPVYSAVPKYVVKPTYENYFQPIASTAYNPPPQQPFYAADFYHHPLAQASSASNPIEQESSLRKLEGSDEDDPDDGGCLVKTLELLFNQLFGAENARGYH